MKYAHYLHRFESNAEFESAYTGGYYHEPWVSATLIPSAETEMPDYYRVDYNISDRRKYLTFVVESDGVIRWKAANASNIKTIQYKKNSGEWTNITSATGDSAPSISVVSGDIVKFRGDNLTYSSDYSYYNTFSGTTCGFKLEGNAMSLVDSTDFADITTLESGMTFNFLFYGCYGLTDASKLQLPATTLSIACYRDMFAKCTSLTSSPALPGETTAIRCYADMFNGCTSLTEIPSILPVMILSDYCYDSMFCGCSSITTAPALPATTLATSCYAYMFQGCSSLTTAPELPAPTLLHDSYYEMFTGCTRLNYIKCLAVSGIINYNGSTDRWVVGVSSTGTFVKSPDVSESTWGRSGSGIPENWTVQDA